MEHTACPLCGADRPRFRFRKRGRYDETFTLVRCTSCGLEYLNPRPAKEEMGRYYGEEYFTTRTDRGYDNYFSDETRVEVQRVLELNLRDLGFFPFEEGLSAGDRRSLDIGCAAGYCVDYLARRNWDARGIDISVPCIEAGRSRGLNLELGDYLEREYPVPFSLITLWATVEHLHRPDRFMEKIRRDLLPGGMVMLSTCRADRAGFRSLFGSGWRYYNFPEHLCFFSAGALQNLLERNGLRVEGYTTYGSGVGTAGSRRKDLADRMAKRWGLGDMMIMSARKMPAPGRQ